MNSLEAAIISRDLLKIKMLLEKDPAMIDLVSDKNVCMALLAAGTGDIDILKYVVEYSRASMNIYDLNHRNMLHYGTLSGKLDVVKYLVERVGMDPKSGDINLVTPFDIAQINGYEDIERYFQEVCGCGIDDMYRNPIRTGMFPDPSIVRVDDDYYMVNSSFIFFPCIPISHSKDLVHWKIIGHAVTNPQWAALDELEGGRGFWAPDISYHDGKFYITATYRLNDDGMPYRKQFIMSSDRPEGPYSKPAIIDEDGIDPSIFVDDDGRKYMLLNRGARILELDRDCTKQISKAELLFYGDHKRAPEGPHLLKKDGCYYLFEAEGGTGPGHRVTVSRSKTLKGVYEPCPYNPIMRQEDDKAAIQRCGHGKPVCTQNGQWFMVYLCGRMIDGRYSLLGRETALDPITWTMDGWPIVNNLKGPSVINNMPKLPYSPYDDDNAYDFTKGKVSLDWMYPRPPRENSFVNQEDGLIINGTGEDLSSTQCRSVILRRQTEFIFESIASMNLSLPKEGQDAGVTCYYDENTYLKFGLFANYVPNIECNEDILVEDEADEKKDTTDIEETKEKDETVTKVEDKNEKKSFTDKYYIGVVEHIGDEYEDMTVGIDVTAELPKEAKTGAIDIWFKIETEYLTRRFYYSFDGIKYKLAGTLDNVFYLCDEGIKKGKRFTGAMVGMYAHAGEVGGYKALCKKFEYYKDGEHFED